MGRDLNGNQEFFMVPVKAKVQDTLRDMAIGTWNKMQKSVIGKPTQTKFEEGINEGNEGKFIIKSDHDLMQKNLEGGPALYEPSERYIGTEYIYLPSSDGKVTSLKDLHKAANLPIDSNMFHDIDSIFCYFTSMIDDQKHRITSIRRVTGIRGILATKFLTFSAGALVLSDRKLFKLDNAFDIIIDSDNVHIWRPSGFESVGKLREEILAAVSDNVTAIKQDIDFVDFDTVESYSHKHITAARSLASIRAQSTEGRINKTALLSLCKESGVAVDVRDDGVIIPVNVLGFLDILERRRYTIELIDGIKEQFRAGSRRRIN